MCGATTRTDYGILVRTWQLLVAARAFEVHKSAFLFIQLVLLRIKSRTLATSDTGARKTIVDFPVEIWDSIRDGIIDDEEMIDAADYYFRQEYCAECDDAHHVERSDWRKTGAGGNDWEEEQLFEFWLSEPLGLIASFKPITALLDQYGLVNEAQVLHDSKHDTDSFIDLNPITIVSIPVHSTVLMVEISHDGPNASAATFLTFPTLFTAPSISTNRRFQRLVRDFGLDYIPSLNLNFVAEVPAEDADVDEESEKNRKPRIIIESKLILSTETSSCS